MEEVRKSRPSTLTELKGVVEAFAESVDPEEPNENSGGSRTLKYQNVP